MCLIAIAVSALCDGCIANMVAARRKLDAPRKELAETIGMAVFTGGGSSMLHTAEARSAFDA